MGAPLIGLRIDIESRSRTDIKAGVYAYTEDPSHRVLCVSYSILRRLPDGTAAQGRIRRLDPKDAQAFAAFKKALLDPTVEKHAFNAAFERVVLSKFIGLPAGEYIDPENWRCSALRANANGVFGSLDEVARALRSPIQKDPEGRRLINLFAKPDKKDGRFHRRAVCWCGADHSEDFEKFWAYCDNDVLTEAGIAALLPDIPEMVQREYEADQRINDRGIRHHQKTAVQAVAQVAAEKERLMGKLQALTGLDNPNSIQQMQRWLDEQGYPMRSLNKASRNAALVDPECPPKVKKALTLRGAASLSSVAKHQAALKTRCADGRIRGSLQFYGAHTGREAGRGIQPQNLPRAEASEVDRRRLLKGKAGKDAPEIAKGSVRASLIPAKGCAFVVVDYNAIEARTLGWLSGEKWVLDEFRHGQGKIYEATASTMFRADKAALIAALAACDKCGSCEACAVRDKGKVSNLALGYAGGAGALVTMGAEGAGIDIGNFGVLHAEWEAMGRPGKFHEWETSRHAYPELLRLRDTYRDASPATVSFWKQCAVAWDRASLGGSMQFGDNGVVTMMRDGRHNRMVLPSGRSIWYRHARSHADPERDGRIDRRTFIGKGSGVGHTRVETHGGKLTENVTQAVARDALFALIMKIEKMTAKGWPGKLVLHVHDEVVLEVPKASAEQVLADVKGWMSKSPKWGKTLPLKGEGSIMDRYRK